MSLDVLQVKILLLYNIWNDVSVRWPNHAAAKRIELKLLALFVFLARTLRHALDFKSARK